MSNIKDVKIEYRTRAKEILKTLDDDIFRNKVANGIMLKLLRQPEYKEAKTIMLYVSAGKEVITSKLMLFVLLAGKKVCLPLCTDTKNHIMEARLWNSDYRLETGAYGIPAPREDAPEIKPEEIDLLVLPCVACDKECNRLGHGAGYYDRFIDKLRPDCSKLALCYDNLVFDKIPTEDHDVKMDAVITEKNIYRR